MQRTVFIFIILHYYHIHRMLRESLNDIFFYFLIVLHEMFLCVFKIKASQTYSVSLGRSLAADAELGVSAVVSERNSFLTDITLLLVPVETPGQSHTHR